VLEVFLSRPRKELGKLCAAASGVAKGSLAGAKDEHVEERAQVSNALTRGQSEVVKCLCQRGAVSNIGGTEGVTGFNPRGGVDVDFYALHWYGEGLGPFYDQLWSTYYQLRADKKVLVAEFAVTNWSGECPLGRGAVEEEFCRESCRYLEGLE
jgi:hypothetical protein